MNRIVLASFVAFMGLAMAMGCAKAEKLDQVVYDVTKNVVDGTEALCLPDAAKHCTRTVVGSLTDAQFKQASLVEHAIAVQGSSFNALLAKGTAKPIDAAALLEAVSQAIDGLGSIPPLAPLVRQVQTLEGRLRDFMGSLAPARAGG